MSQRAQVTLSRSRRIESNGQPQAKPGGTSVDLVYEDDAKAVLLGPVEESRTRLALTLRSISTNSKPEMLNNSTASAP